MAPTSETTRAMLGRSNGTEAQFSRDRSFFPNDNAEPSLECFSVGILFRATFLAFYPLPRDFYSRTITLAQALEA